MKRLTAREKKKIARATRRKFEKKIAEMERDRLHRRTREVCDAEHFPELNPMATILPPHLGGDR